MEMSEAMTHPDEIEKRCVALVRFGPSGFETDGFRPGEYYQVTIDPDKISQSGQFIRFGDTPGDELIGWQRCKALCVIEILGEWDGENPPSLRYGPPHLTRLLEQ